MIDAEIVLKGLFDEIVQSKDPALAVFQSPVNGISLTSLGLDPEEIPPVAPGVLLAPNRPTPLRLSSQLCAV